MLKMIKVDMLRYHNAFTMKMTDAQLHFLKLKVDLMDSKVKAEKGHSDYENILMQEAQRMAIA
jgi:hypothetical protein